jgi:hypothetical protein
MGKIYLPLTTFLPERTSQNMQTLKPLTKHTSEGTKRGSALERLVVFFINHLYAL